VLVEFEKVVDEYVEFTPSDVVEPVVEVVVEPDVVSDPRVEVVE
jgi:hypothetical protein